MRDSLMFYGEDDEQERKPEIHEIDIPFVIRPGVIARVRIPVDATMSEIKRLTAMLETVPLPTPGAQA